MASRASSSRWRVDEQRDRHRALEEPVVGVVGQPHVVGLRRRGRRSRAPGTAGRRCSSTPRRLVDVDGRGRRVAPAGSTVRLGRRRRCPVSVVAGHRRSPGSSSTPAGPNRCARPTCGTPRAAPARMTAPPRGRRHQRRSSGSTTWARWRTVCTESPDSTPPRASSRPPCQLDRPSSGRVEGVLAVDPAGEAVADERGVDGGVEAVALGGVVADDRGDEARAVAVAQLDGGVDVGASRRAATSGECSHSHSRPRSSAAIGDAAGSTCSPSARRTLISSLKRAAGTAGRDDASTCRPGRASRAARRPRRWPRGTRRRDRRARPGCSTRSACCTPCGRGSGRRRRGSARRRRQPPATSHAPPVPWRLTGVPAWRATAPSWATAAPDPRATASDSRGSANSAQPAERAGDRTSDTVPAGRPAAASAGSRAAVDDASTPCRGRRTRCASRRCCRCAARRWRRRRRWAAPRRRTRRRRAGPRRASTDQPSCSTRPSDSSRRSGESRPRPQAAHHVVAHRGGQHETGRRAAGGLGAGDVGGVGGERSGSTIASSARPLGEALVELGDLLVGATGEGDEGRHGGVDGGAGRGVLGGRDVQQVTGLLDDDQAGHRRGTPRPAPRRPSPPGRRRRRSADRPPSVPAVASGHGPQRTGVACDRSAW